MKQITTQNIFMSFFKLLGAVAALHKTKKQQQL
jgi:hypothetical protein